MVNHSAENINGEIPAGRKISQSKGDKVFMFCVYTFLAAALILVMYPLIYVISSSLSSPNAVIAGRVWLYPVDFSLEGYKRVFSNVQVMTGYKNSVINVILGTCINIAMTVLAAYPLSRKTFSAKNIFMRLFVFTMLFSGGLIPLYMVVNQLGLNDSRWALMLPNAMTVYYVIITRTFFSMSIPEEVYESAYIDGCQEFRIIRDMVLPLSKPIIAVLALMYAIAHWNSYFSALIFLKSQSLYTLQLVLRNILIQNSVDISSITDLKTALEMEGMRDLLKYALIVVASLPVMALYPFAQKYFVKGMMLGAVKG